MSQSPNSRDIEAFNMVAMELSFRRAADRLGIDQSALSRRIRHLEEMIGFQLLHRTTREVSLTNAGEIFHEETRLLSNRIDTAVQVARVAAEGRKGRLRIGYMSFAAIDVVPRIVHEFRRRYPDVDLTLKYIRTQGQKIDLARNGIDVGFMLGPFSHPQFGVQPICVEPLVAILPSHHRLATRESITLPQLAGSPFILGSMEEWDFFRRYVVDMFAQVGLAVEARYEVSDTMGILGLVGMGLGVSVYSSGIQVMQPRNIVTKPLEGCESAIETILVWNRVYRSHALDNFIEVARKIYGPSGLKGSVPA